LFLSSPALATFPLVFVLLRATFSVLSHDEGYHLTPRRPPTAPTPFPLPHNAGCFIFTFPSALRLRVKELPALPPVVYSYCALPSPARPRRLTVSFLNGLLNVSVLVLTIVTLDGGVWLHQRASTTDCSRLAACHRT
jgi:hypothetical protein